MRLSEYREARGPASFQAAFLERVVRGDSAYYEPIAHLLERAGVELERTVITDICRASFGCWDGTRVTAGTDVLRSNDIAFRPYVRENEDWHNSRLDEGGFLVIVTLGTLAGDEVESWLRRRGWRARGPSRSFTSPAGRVVNILRAPHPNAWGQRPADVAERLRELLGGPKPEVPRGNEHKKPRDEALDKPIAAYNATRLLFRKTVIESLRLDESFQVNTPVGNFRFTKQEFYKSFPGVVQSRSYQTGGIYHYPKVPKYAEPFRVE
jgi:hypothetical protein